MMNLNMVVARDNMFLVDDVDATMYDHIIVAFSGDKAWLEKYCTSLLAFGARTASGNGRIDKCTITSIPRDFSIVHPGFGVNRPVPVKATEALGLPGARTDVAMLSCKPPNWSRPNHVLCRIPEGFT